MVYELHKSGEFATKYYNNQLSTIREICNAGYVQLGNAMY